jgi:hypothetical protein
MRVYGRMVKNRGMVCMCGQMEQSIVETGKMARRMVLENSYIQMELNILENIRMVKKMELVASFSKMGLDKLVNGKMESTKLFSKR